MKLKRAMIFIFVTLIVMVPALGNISFAADTSDNERIIYEFLKAELGLNEAQACGVLANIYGESSFNPKASCIDVDGYESYGLCQWHVGRHRMLISYCDSHNLDYTTVEGQLQYLKYELLGDEKYAYSMILGLPNTAEGAYTAGYNWSKYFGRGASSLYEIRGNMAKTMFWPKYASSAGSQNVNISEGEYYIINDANGMYLTVPSHGQSNGDDVSLQSLGDTRYFKFSIRKGSFGYIIKPTYTDNAVVNIYTSALVESGNDVRLWKATGNSSQEWVFRPISGGYVICSAQRPECVLDYTGGTVKVMTYSSGSGTQVWRLFSLEAPAVPPEAVTPNVMTGAAGYTTQFTWPDVSYANEYDITIYNESIGTSVISKTVKDTSFSIALQEGIYTVSVNSVNNLGNSQRLVTEGSSVQFSVLEGHSHDFSGRTEVLAEATCSQVGLSKIFCKDEECGQFLLVETPKLEHTYSTLFVPSTPYSNGVILKVCDVCKDTVVERMLPIPTETSPIITVLDTEVEAGKAVVVPVTLKNSKNITIGMFSVKYDESKAVLKSITTSSGKITNFTSFGSAVYFEVTKSDSADIVFNFKFEVKSDAYGSFNVTPNYAINSFYSSDYENVYPAVSEGVVSIIRNDIVLGDADKDGDITSSDLLIVRKYIAGILTEKDIFFPACDVDKSGEITMSDALMIRKYIAGILTAF